MSDPRLHNVLLRHGSHTRREQGMCAMELAAYLADEEHSDDPRSVHPDLKALIITMNDSYDDDRQRTIELMPLVLASIGTAGTVMDIAPVKKAYFDAIVTARQACDDAILTAGKAYDTAIVTAGKVYHDAITPATKAYDDAIHKARKARDEATATAKNVYHDAIVTARKVYQDAITPVRRHCIAALLAECNRCAAETD